MKDQVVVDANGCWIWQGAIKSNGYGNVIVEGRTVLAHRRAWEQRHGPVPAGLCVLHHCDVRACVNPEHLFLGTKRDNTHDMMRKGRHRMPRKLTPEQRQAIRVAHAAGFAQGVLAVKYGVSQGTVSNIVRGVHP